MTQLQTAESLAKTIVNLKTANELIHHLKESQIEPGIKLINKNKFLWIADEQILYKL